MSFDAIRHLTNEVAVQRTRLDVLTRQAASGKKAENLGELSPEVPRTIHLRGDIGRREAYSRVIVEAQGRASVTQNAMGRMESIAKEFRNDVTMRINSNDPSTLLTATSRARAALSEVVSILNTRYGNEYMFGGSDLSNPPIPNEANVINGNLATQIANEINQLGTLTADQITTNTRNLAADTTAGVTIFSDFLEDPARGGGEARRSVPSSDGDTISYGIFANRNTASQSTGETSGSWARDLIRGLMSVAALTPSQMAANPKEFDALVGRIRAGFQAAETGLADEQGVLGTMEKRMETSKARNDALADAIKKQLSSIEEVDLAEPYTKMQTTQVNLEASYRTIARLSSLSLANYLN